MNDLNGKQRVLQTLQSGNWISTPELAEKVGLQHNTSVKWLHFLRKEGWIIEDRKVPGKQYNEYHLAGNKSICNKDPDILLMREIETVLGNYPENHIDYKKGMIQIEQLRKRVAA